MIIQSTAPSRISLFGGGSDIEGYDGFVISMAINLRQHTTLFTEDDSYQPINSFPFNAKPEFYYSILNAFGLGSMHHCKIQSKFDGFIESGLGSSGAAGVALIGAISKAKDLNLSLGEIAELAYQIESKTNVTGRQDHYASAFGGVNAIEFKQSVTVTPLARGFIEPLIPSFVLEYIGGKHLKKNKEKPNVKQLDEIKQLAVSSIDYIARGDIKMVGKLMNESWQIKKKNKGITDTNIDKLYQEALDKGAYGGKVLGSGGGGYMFYIIDPSKRGNFKGIDFSISWDGLDTRIL